MYFVALKFQNYALLIIFHLAVKIILEFTKEWNFNLVTSSPNYPQSNGLAEKSVEIAKTTLKKSFLTEVDLELFLLDYRNTPVAGLDYTPSELLMNRRLRTKLPINEKLLCPRTPINVKTKILAQQKYQKVNYNKTDKTKVSKYEVNDTVLWSKK